MLVLHGIKPKTFSPSARSANRFKNSEQRTEIDFLMKVFFCLIVHEFPKTSEMFTVPQYLIHLQLPPI